MEFLNLEKPVDSTNIDTIISQFKNGEIKAGDTVYLKGYIHRIREMSGFAFVIIRTPRLLVQCIYDPNLTDFDLANACEEACVVVKGKVVDD